MEDLTTNEKGAIAENAVLLEAVKLGIEVLRPVVPGRRYDLAFDFGDRIERVQCKWGRLVDDVIVTRTGSCRHSPTRGSVRRSYDCDEVDAIAVYCGALDRCYYVPVEMVAGKFDLHLRLRPAKNNQRTGVTMAGDYSLGAIAQLGERLRGTQEVAGSSPASSTP